MFVPIIMAGGSGSRLWPLSRQLYPKQFLSISGEQTLLQQTVTRLAGLGTEPPLLICYEEHHSDRHDGRAGQSARHYEGEPAAATGAPMKSDAVLNAEPRITLVPIVPGAPNFQPTLSRSGEKYANDPKAVEVGRQLYNQMNCVGCHFNGGGGIGPALIDDAWIYGDSIDNIATIFEGRPNGMPSFRHLVPEDQIWQLAAFVHGWAQGKAEMSDKAKGEGQPQ